MLLYVSVTLFWTVSFLIQTPGWPRVERGGIVWHVCSGGGGTTNRRSGHRRRSVSHRGRPGCLGRHHYPRGFHRDHMCLRALEKVSPPCNWVLQIKGNWFSVQDFSSRILILNFSVFVLKIFVKNLCWFKYMYLLTYIGINPHKYLPS